MSEKSGEGPAGENLTAEEKIGHYTIVSELGRGGMGVVYKAHEESLNRLVALKVLGKHLSEDESFVARFKREAQSAAALNHPNIVQVYAISEFDGQHCFAMEFVRGSSVQQVIRSEGPMDPVKAARLVLQAASGLGAAHGKGIYHRDIKPANLMLDENGLLKIADFGLAILAAGTTQLTATGMFMGTPGYLSPEQCLGDNVDQRTDIYALGVTLYEMLTGVTPLKADSPLALLRQIIDVEPRDVGELRPEVPESLRVILRKMMAKKPEDRYSDCANLITDLQLWLATVGAKGEILNPGVDSISYDTDVTSDDTVIAPVHQSDENTIKVPAGSLKSSASTTSTSKRNSMSALVIALVLMVVAGASYATWKYVAQTSGTGEIVDGHAGESDFAVSEPSTYDANPLHDESEDSANTEVGQALEDTPLFVGSSYPELGPQDGGDELDLQSPSDSWSDDAAALGVDDMPDATGQYASVVDHASALGNEDGSDSVSSNLSEPDSYAFDTGASFSGTPDAMTSYANSADVSSSKVVASTPKVATPVVGTGVALVSVGEILLANSASDYVRETLSRYGIPVIDGMSIPGVADMLANGGGDLQSLIKPAARYLVYIRADFTGERELYYMGRPDIELQSRLNLETHDLRDGQPVGEGVHASIGYTSLSVEDKVQALLRPEFDPVVSRLSH